MKDIAYVLVITGIIVIGVVYFLFSKPSYIPGDYTPHIKGTGGITIVEFSDFQCPFCGRAVPTLKDVLTEYDGKVSLVYRHYPLPSHSFAQKAAEASECASDLGGNEKFWQYHDKLFANQNALHVQNLKKFAADIGLDSKQFDACLDSGAMASRVGFDAEEGRKLGVSGTPAFFINGKSLKGAQPFSEFKKIIDAELGK